MALYKSDILEAIAEIQCILVVHLETGEILYASRSADVLFGYPMRGELVGKNVDELVPTSVREKHTGHRATYAKNPYARLMGATQCLMGRKFDGTEFPVKIVLAPCMITSTRCVVANIMDLSEPTGSGIQRRVIP